MRAACGAALVALGVMQSTAHAQQPAGAPGDGVEVTLRAVLAGGDPIQGQFSYWIARAPAARARGEPRASWLATVTIDTRQAPNRRGADAPSTVAVHAAGLSAAELAVARASVRVRAPLATTNLGVLGDDTTAVETPAVAGAAAAPARALAGSATATLALTLDPPGARPIIMVPSAIHVPAEDRTQTRTLRYTAPGRLAEGDTLWIVVSDAGTRRWVQPAVLRRMAAANVSLAPPPPPPRSTVPVVFAVGQHPGDARVFAPGFSAVAQPISPRVQAAQGAAVSSADAAMVAAVRAFGVTALDVAMPRPGEVAIRIVDLQGRVVARLGPETLAEGYWVMRWDGRRSDGAPAAPGVYLAIAEALSARVVNRLIITR
jgi:hypothetical protein